MANKFSFRIAEQDLIAVLANIEHQKKTSPSQNFALEVSVDLFPDGVGYIITDLKTTIIEDTKEAKETKDA